MGTFVPTELEKVLLMELLFIHYDLQETLKLTDAKNELRAGAVIGGRIVLIRKLIGQKMDMVEGFRDFIQNLEKELSEQGKALQQQEDKAPYFG